MSDLTENLAKNEQQILRLIATTSETLDNPQNVEDVDSEAENAIPSTTSTPIKTKTTTHKNPPIMSRNCDVSLVLWKPGLVLFCIFPHLQLFLET